MSACSASRTHVALSRALALALALAAGGALACSVIAPGQEELSSGRCSASQKLCSDTCVSLDEAATGCGAKGCAPCALSHAVTKCSARECAVAGCELGYADCNGVASDGCEVDLRNDPKHCGACDAACSGPSATSECHHGKCVVTGCASGYAECDGDPATTCETHVALDPANCGACEGACALPHADSNACAAGSCTVDECAAGFGDCNGVPEDGCETDTSRDSSHCGSCAKACDPDQICAAGACAKKCYAMRALHRQARLSVAPLGFGVGAGDFTVELWLAWNGDFGGTVVFAMNEDYVVSGVQILATPESLQCTVVNPSGTGAGSGSAKVIGPPPVVGRWTHVACTRAQGSLNLFIDGSPAGSAPVATDFVALSPVAIGAPGGYLAQNVGAAPVTIGPLRCSQVARYTAAFTPSATWPVDSDTLFQILTTEPFKPGALVPLVDEAGGDNSASYFGGFAPALAEIGCP